MTQTTVEIANIRLRDGATEAELLAASNLFQRDFLDQQPGFIRRELLRLQERAYLDLIHWQSAADAEAIMGKVAGSSACSAYFSVMDMTTDDPTEGVKHCISLASYGQE